MGIQLLQGPLGEVDKRAAGIFSLPSNFDIEKHAAKWAKMGNAVAAAQVREHLLGTKLTADGWEVWKDGITPAHGKPYKVPTLTGEYVLLFRPREVQNAVNAIYGNLGKERMLAEKKGETTGGVPITDPGILGDSVLRRVMGSEGSEEDGAVVMNAIPNVERVATTSLNIRSQEESEESLKS